MIVSNNNYVRLKGRFQGGVGFLSLRKKFVSLSLICINFQKVNRGVSFILFLSTFAIHQHAHSEQVYMRQIPIYVK